MIHITLNERLAYELLRDMEYMLSHTKEYYEREYPKDAYDSVDSVHERMVNIYQIVDDELMNAVKRKRQ